MKNIENIKLTLKRMAELLRLGERDDWEGAIEKIQVELDNSPDSAISIILSMYGGMGSLNDIVLYRNMNLLIEENIELDTLRSKLYHLCHGDS